MTSVHDRPGRASSEDLRLIRHAVGQVSPVLDHGAHVVAVIPVVTISAQPILEVGHLVDSHSFLDWHVMLVVHVS